MQFTLEEEYHQCGNKPAVVGREPEEVRALLKWVGNLHGYSLAQLTGLIFQSFKKLHAKQ